jgi:parvulin-like peptidyl-prolyl isomerase
MKQNFVITIITTAIFLAGLPLRLLAQMPLESSHQPTMSAPAPGDPSRAAVASEGAGEPVKPPLTQIVRVNGVVLTEAQLDQEMQRLFPYYSIHGGRVPAGAEAEIRQKAIHELVLHELVYQEARRRNLQIPPLKWQKRLQQIRQEFPSRQAYEAAATKEYGSVAAYERALRRVMLVEQLWDAEVTRKSVVTAEAERAYYQSHKAQYVRPEAVWLQTITIKFPGNATAEQKQQAYHIAEQILVKAKAAKDYEEFGMLAQQLSEDDWRVMMGDHRWVHRGTVTPDLEQAVFSMKAGETSDVVESSSGYVILRANEHQPKRQMSFTEMSASIRQRLASERREKRAKEFEQLLRSKAEVQML